MLMSYRPDPLKRLHSVRLKMYLILLREGRALSVREMQQLIGMKSPGVVKYHLDKLVIDGLAEKYGGKYKAVKPGPNSFLSLYFIFIKTAIPRAMTYAIFITVAFITYLVIRYPEIDLSLSLIVIVAIGFLWYESIKMLRIVKGL